MMLLMRTLYTAALAAAFAVAACAQFGRPAMTPAQEQYLHAMEKADLAIQAENRAHSQLMQNEEYLTTEIGPRLTGGANMQHASEWTLEMFRKYGLKAHLETTHVAHSWTPGISTAVLLNPWHKVIPIAAEGWSKATDGPVTGPVVIYNPGEAVDRAAIQGAIVLEGPPNDRNVAPDAQFPNSYDSVIMPPTGVPDYATMQRRMAAFRAMMSGGANPLAGAAVVIRDSGKPWGLFSIGGAGRYAPSQVPTATLGHEDYSLLYRMIHDYHNHPRMTVMIGGTFSAGPEPASITVAQIPGTEWPDQQVIVGGHLDSWYLGQGAVDNGTGAMATLEAARILSSLGWKPKRTLTFILFTGEEEGGVGVDTFVKNHLAEMPKVDAVLIDDVGTGHIESIPIEGFYNAMPELSAVYQPLKEVFDLQPISTEYFGASDHVAFQRQGIPAFLAVQAEAHYREEHHSQIDTFEMVDAKQANQGAAVLAAFLWNVSQLDTPFPHRKPSPGRGF